MNYMSENIDQLGTALAKAQGEMSAASKDCNNPFFKSKYADLNSIWEACRAPMAKHGLSITQIESRDDSGPILVSILIHSSGQWVKSIMPIKIKADGKTNELQVMGSVYTYLRRYSLAALVGVSAADEDDDGNTGGKNYQSQQAAAPTSPPVASRGISHTELTSLMNAFEKCSPAFKQSAEDFLTKNKIPGFASMSHDSYKSMLAAALADIKYQKEGQVTV